LSIRLEIAKEQIKNVDNKNRIDLKEKLDQAQSYFDKGELDWAENQLKKFKTSLDSITKLKSEADGDGEPPPPPPHLKLRTLATDKFIKVPDRYLAYRGEKIYFQLEGESINNPNWHMKKFLFPFSLEWGIKPVPVPVAVELRKLYELPLAGAYKLTVEFTDQNGYLRKLSLDLTVVPDPFPASAQRVRISAWASQIVWAFIATVAGLVYIDAQLPTFGSPTDYFLALAWAFGLSTTAKPAESLASTIYDILTGKKRVTGQDEPATQKVTVPDTLVGKTKAQVEAELKKVGLKAAFKTKDGKGSEDDWIVEKPTDPDAKEMVDKNSTVTCTLIPPPDIPKKPVTNKVPVPDTLVGLTQAQAEAELKKVPLIGKFETKDGKKSEDDWIVEKPTDPDAKKMVNKDSTVICTLVPPEPKSSKKTPEEEKTGKEAGSQGSNT